MDESKYRVREADLIRQNVRAYLSRHERKDMLRFLTAGSVDDGKSTLIGRLLYDAKMIYEDQLSSLLQDSTVHGTTGDGFDPALLTDGLKAEREQGITIDVAYRYFSTERRNFIICDAPGHEQYTRNMATGASHCDLAIILIDARYGVVAQTRRHSFIAGLLGIRHFVVAVNKMDLVDYDEDVFRQIRRDYEAFAAKLEVADVHFLPISALKGDNVVERSDKMPWYQAEPLLAYLENVEIAIDRNLIDLRFPVQYVLRPNLNFRGYAGTLASGIVRTGDELMVLPSGRSTRVKAIHTFEGEIELAFAPMAVTLTVTDEVDISRGDLLVHPNNTPRVDNLFEAQLVWMSEQSLSVGAQLLLKCGTNVVPVSLAQLRYAFDVNTLHREPVEEFSLNTIGRVVIRTHRPLAVDSYSRNRQTGGFILIDRFTNNTVAAGMILDQPANTRLPGRGHQPVKETERLESSASQVSMEERQARLGQSPFTIWLTGLPGAGKSTIAFALERELFDRGFLPHVLDGQNLRLELNSDLTFSGMDRSENIRRAAAVAKICNRAGVICIAAFVSPYICDREAARDTVGREKFIEIHVNTPLNVCESRDPQRLLADGRSGDVGEVSGITAPYEAPADPALRVSTERLDTADIVGSIIHYLEKSGYLKRLA